MSQRLKERPDTPRTVAETSGNPGASRPQSGPLPAPFGVYVHWPWCLAKCPYCDFNSHVRHRPVDADGFAKPLISELKWLAERAPGRVVSSVFFGGGTPSLMPPEVVAAILDQIGKSWAISEACEVTLEANPTSSEASNFQGYRTAGVNRLSVGVQALKDEDLQRLGRKHTATEALAAYRLAAGIFPRTSFDLIYARPHQSVDAWRNELRQALSEQQGHMSLYQLTIEPETVFSIVHAAGKLPLPDEEEALALYDVTQEMTQKVGLSAYEVSNHAMPGHECRHNLTYWRAGEYAGVGPGAHSRLSDEYGRRSALSTEKDPEKWRDLVARKGAGVTEETHLSSEEACEEVLLMGLRLTEGIELSGHPDLARKLDKETLKFFVDQGLIRSGDGRLAATPKGRRVLDSLIPALLSQ